VTGSATAHTGAFQNITDGYVNNRSREQSLFIQGVNSWAQVDLLSTIDVERVEIIMPYDSRDCPITDGYTLHLLNATDQGITYTCKFTKMMQNHCTYTFNFEKIATEASIEVTATAKALAAARAAAKYAVLISGATGENSALVNGVYDVTDEVSGGIPVYKKREAEQWLEYHVSRSMWMSRSTETKGQTNVTCHASVACAIGVLPDKAPTGTWQVYDGAAWRTQASVMVSPSA